MDANEVRALAQKAQASTIDIENMVDDLQRISNDIGCELTKQVNVSEGVFEETFKKMEGFWLRIKG